jgi:hypothetical protein
MSSRLSLWKLYPQLGKFSGTVGYQLKTGGMLLDWLQLMTPQRTFLKDVIFWILMDFEFNA